MKHAIATRLKFDEDNFELMEWYIKVGKATLFPQLNKQTNQNFDWVIITNPKHDDWIREHLTGYTYTIMHDYDTEFACAGYNLQTRHDIDDWMHESYVQSLQETVELYGSKPLYDKCLLHVNLIRINFFTQQTELLPVWNSKNTSQFLSMYQKDIDTKLHVYMDEHTKMPQYVPQVIELPLGLTMQVLHNRNRSNG